MKVVKLSDGSEIVDRRTGNGSNKLIWWLMVTFFSLALTGGTGWLLRLDTALADMQLLAAHRGERLATVEAKFLSIDARLTRIEGKVDLLLERKR